MSSARVNELEPTVCAAFLVQRNVDTSAFCARGWHYSEDSTQVEICGETCDLIRSTPGELEMMVGCVTKWGPA
jgi:hypothetical protein